MKRGPAGIAVVRTSMYSTAEKRSRIKAFWRRDLRCLVWPVGWMGDEWKEGGGSSVANYYNNYS